MTTVATATVAAQCRDTPTVQVVDNRGLVVRILQYNRSVVEAAADELITRQRYTPTGQLASSLDPRLAVAQQLDSAVAPNFRYDSSLSGKSLRSVSQDAGARVCLYDIAGGPVWQRDSRGQQTRWLYDALHRCRALLEQAANEPERVSERYTYADGATVAAAANCRGRLVAHHDTAGLNETPRYSLTGQALVSMRRLLAAGVMASDWQDAATEWEAALEAHSYTSRQGFDALGRVAWSWDARDNRQVPAYNVAGQLANSQLTLAGQATPQVLLRSVAYSAAGQVQREEAGNGVVSDYTYEPQTQRLSRLRVTRPAQGERRRLLQDLSYCYDPVGNILTLEDAAQTVRYHQNQRIAPLSQYQYDALYQLLTASGRENANAGPQGPHLPPPEVPLSQDPNSFSHYTRSYQYDRGGNLTRVRHQGRQNYSLELVVAPTSNRAVQQTGFLTPTDVDGHFDASGNLRQLAPGQPLTWDGRNQLQQVTMVPRDAEPNDHEWYRYDGAGQRLLKASFSQTSGTQRQAEVIYLPGLELRRTTSSRDGVHTTVEDLQVIRGQAVGRAQVRVLHWNSGQPPDMPNDQVRYSLDDQVGSSLLELDQAADVLTLEEYFPYGGTAVWSGRSLSETQYKFVRYSGKERDATGLYYYGFRYYAPWLGRWLNPDPAGTVDGLNLFRMVGNNPITYQDTAGLWRELSKKKEIPKKENIILKTTTSYQGELLGIYGSQLKGSYKLTQASINNVYNGGKDVAYIGLVDLKKTLIHLIPLYFSVGSQYNGKPYPGAFFEVNTEKGKTNNYDASEAVTADDRGSAHLNALRMVAEDGNTDESKIMRYIGFTFAPELSKKQQGSRYSLFHFHGRSRTLNSPKSPERYKGGFYAADYYIMKANGKISYQAIGEDFYRKENEAHPPAGLYGDPETAATGTLSESISSSIKDAVVTGLILDRKYDTPRYSNRASAIYTLARRWEITDAPAPQTLATNASASRLGARR